MTLSIGSLFSGIGGLELGLERAGLGPVRWQVEVDPWRREVLARQVPARSSCFPASNEEAKQEESCAKSGPAYLADELTNGAPSGEWMPPGRNAAEDGA